MLASWFPTLPTWDGLHPVLVQFPLALLLVAPLLVVLSLVFRPAWRAWSSAALLVMWLGTLAAWLAVGSGHAAGQLIEKTPALQSVILRHEALGVATRNAFTVLTLAYAALLLVPLLLKRTPSDALRIGLHVAFLAFYAAFTGMLAHAADAGGHLVHEHGVRAMVQRAQIVEGTHIAGEPAPPPPAR